MSNMNDLDFEQSHEFLLEHKNEFNKFKTDFDNLYSKYKNRSKIIVLLDYWIFNVLLLKKIYGSEGLVNFCNSYINNPQRFSFFYELLFHPSHPCMVCCLIRSCRTDRSTSLTCGATRFPSRGRRRRLRRWSK